jgi:hypothetical protein
MIAAVPAAASAVTAASSPRHAVVCQHRPGHTILHHGVVRVFKAPGAPYPTVYGCVEGSTRAVALWEAPAAETMATPQRSGAVKQVAGRFVAIESTTSNQYEDAQSIQVFDLGSGARYDLASEQEPLGQTSVPAGRHLETWVLGADGRTAALYGTYAAGPSAGANPTGQVLDLLGFHSSSSQLAAGPPGAIAPASVAFNGATVTWTQDGEPHSATG